MIIKYEATIDVDIDDQDLEQELRNFQDLIDFHIKNKVLSLEEVLLESKVSR